VRALDGERTADAATAAHTRPVGDVRDDLAAQLARNPRDARGWVLLARLELGEDRYAQAATAYEKALANAKAATDVDLWCEYADALALAQGGRLDGKPRDIVQQALLRDPKHRRALEMAGGAALESGDYAQAARYWRTLLGELPEGTSEQRELSLALERVELMAQDDRSRGQLLYETHCVACHSKKIHWRDRKLVTDWATLVAQTDRWQRNSGLGWSGEEVDAVARFLGRQVYRLPEVPRTRG
jgi:tetratricopeptide (TPR) repeat protein